MCTYLKNMEGYKLKDLKSKGFDFIQEMFRAFKRVNTFEDFRTFGGRQEKRTETELYKLKQRSKRWKMTKKQQSLNSVWKSF
ncbi:hypothetical protein Tco_0017451 [Tanacetum coccineum]